MVRSDTESMWIRLLAGAAVVGGAAVAALLGCTEGGGNANQQTPGSGAFGVTVAYGDIAIEPHGGYFLYRADDRLALGDLTTRAARVLPGIEQPRRVVFGHDGRTIYLTAGDDDSGELLAYDVRTEAVRWRRAVDLQDTLATSGADSFPLLQITGDDRRLAVTSPAHLDVVDPATGAVASSADFPRAVVDVDLVEDQRAVVTLLQSWDGDVPTAQVTAVDLDTGVQQTAQVPNCAANLVVDPASGTGYLAPTQCSKDPVSVIDLRTMAWERNLPGFGPVVLAPGGGTVVAFADATVYDETLAPGGPVPDSTAGRYHLMLIDAATRGFELLPLGATLPRYTLTPDGAILLIDAADSSSDGRVRLLDVATRRLTETTGPDIRLDHFAMTRNGQTVFMLEAGLFELAVSTGVIARLELAFTPENLNLTPDESTLLLREDDETVRLFDLRVEPPAPDVELPRIDLELSPTELSGGALDPA